MHMTNKECELDFHLFSPSVIVTGKWTYFWGVHSLLAIHGVLMNLQIIFLDDVIMARHPIRFAVSPDTVDDIKFMLSRQKVPFKVLSENIMEWVNFFISDNYRSWSCRCLSIWCLSWRFCLHDILVLFVLSQVFSFLLRPLDKWEFTKNLVARELYNIKEDPRSRGVNYFMTYELVSSWFTSNSAVPSLINWGES